MDDGDVARVVESHREWIVKKREQRLARLRSNPPKNYVEGEAFLYLGHFYELQYVADAKKTFEFDSFRFLLDREYARHAKSLLIDWYQKEMRRVIVERVKLFAERHGCKVASIKISNADKRWGSCSRKGRLNFSWRLIMAPLDVVDYVVVHELAHLKEHNHSKRFWNRVHSMLPAYKIPKAWIKKNGHLLKIG